MLVGGFNPFGKYARQIGSFPQGGMKIKNTWNHPLAWFMNGFYPNYLQYWEPILQAGEPPKVDPQESMISLGGSSTSHSHMLTPGAVSMVFGYTPVI